MRQLYIFLWSSLSVLLLGFSPSQAAAPRQEATLLNATQVLSELLNAPDQNVPHWLLDRAYAVAVLPEVIKGGLVFGGRYGSGVMSLRQPDGSWSNPVFITIAGGSWGFQFGVQSTDLMLVFTSKASVEGLIGGKVTLGADASVAAGPLGRQGAAATDIGMNSQIYSYSRNKGLFFGIALDGSAISIDHKAYASYYEKPGILASDITSPTASHTHESGEKFIATLLGRSVPLTTPTPQPVATPSTPPAAKSEPSPQASGLVTYPMEDQKPGSEPPK